MSITITNLRIIPYGQKDVIKPVFGDTMQLSFSLPDHEAGDKYTLALDYERILLPTMRPLCAMTTEYTATEYEAAGTDVSFELEISTERFARWASGLKKPTPIWIQLQRERDGVYTTLLLDDVLALPSVVDGANMVFPGTPLEDKLAKKLDKPTEAGQAGNVLKLGEDGKPIWGDGGGGGSAQQATDAEIDARTNTTHAITPNNLDYAARSVIPNVTTIPAATTAYTLLDASATTNNHSWQYFHAPEAASTYTFPAVTNTAVAHRIKLTIDFTDTQTYAFEDAEGTAITPLFTPSISAGDVYEFDCEYSAVKAQWLIWPHKQGAVSDDYVMQSQVGAANGVAGLDSNGKVPYENLKLATIQKGGIVRPAGSVGGIQISNDALYVEQARYSAIDSRVSMDGGGVAINQRAPLVPSTLNYAVTAALTDAHKIQLTDAQKASAQDTLGAYGTLHLDAAPTTSTPGAFGQHAIDTTTGREYTCQGAVNTGTEAEPVWGYTWVDDINAKGGTFTGDVVHNGSIRKGNLWVYGDLATICTIKYGGHPTQAWNCIFAGSSLTIPDAWCQNQLAVGAGIETEASSGRWDGGKNGNLASGCQRVIGGGTSSSDKLNIEELSWSGDLYISGGHQQGVTTIPAATTAYTLTEGVQSHVPSAASTYTLPAVPQRIIADGKYFTRNPATDGTGYYGWLSGTINRYTASATPAVGDNTYTNTALTSGAKAITAIDERTHECILTVRFSSSVLTYAFEDASGNPLTPLPLAGTIQDGSVVCFRCTWEALLGQWVIEPKLLNPNA